MKKIHSYWTKLLMLFVFLFANLSPLAQLKVLAEDSNTIRYNVSIKTEEKNPDGSDKLIYFQNQTIISKAFFDISGDGAKIPNARTLITIPKVRYNGQIITSIPERVILETAKVNGVNTSRFWDDDDNWYAEYTFDELTGGSIAGVPFMFSFLTGIAPDGATVTPTYKLYDQSDVLLDEGQVTYTVSVPEWDTKKIALSPAEWTRATIDGQNVGWHNTDYWNQTVPATTGEEGYVYSYLLRLFSTTNSYYVPEKIRVVEHLPANAELHPDSLAEGWTYDARTHTAHYSGKFDIHGPNPGTGWQIVADKKIKLIFKNQPILDTTLIPLHQHIQNGTASPYVFTNIAEFYVTHVGGQEVRLTDRTEPVIFTGTGRIFKPSVGAHFNLWGGQTNFAHCSSTFDAELGDITVNYNGSRTLYFSADVSQTNNGSVGNATAGGITTSLKRIEFYNIDDRLTTSNAKFQLFAGWTNQPRALAALNATTTRLVGIKADGSQDELGILTHANWLQLGETDAVYKELHVVFDNPIEMDNTAYNVTLEMRPTDTELEKFRNGTYTDIQRYEMRMRNVWKHSNEADYYDSSLEQRYDDNYTLVRFPKPRATMDASGNYVVPYSLNNVRSQTISAGAYSEGATSWAGLSEEFKNRKWKVISLLPTGIEYSGYVRQWAQLEGKDPVEPKVERDFNNTGKTAVIWEFNTIADYLGREQWWNNGFIEYNVDVTKYTKPGRNVIEHYTVWEGNDIVLPEHSEYVDELDLDKDGDKTEKFMKRTTEITFLPPEEIMTKKLVGVYISEDMGQLALAQDIGGDIYYRLSILNNVDSNLDSMTVIDVLPYIGDHSIVANQAGNYLSRGSQFETPLVKALEDVTDVNGNLVNATMLERFDVFYSLTPQGADLASVRDAEWLTNDPGIAEFTNVVYGDYVLAETATLPNYVLSDETREVSVREDGVVVDLGDFANTPITGSIILKKVDGETKAPLQGVVFALMQDGEEVSRAASDKAGVVRFEKVAYGDYTVVEVKALEGYVLSKETYKARINKFDQILDLGQVTNFKEKKPAVALPKTGSTDILTVWGILLLVVLSFFYFRRKQTV